MAKNAHQLLDIDESITYKNYSSMIKRRPQPTSERAPHPGDLIKVIRALAAQGKIAFTSHAFDDRMDERGIDLTDALEIFRLGDIDGKIVPGKKAGEWRCLVVGKLHWTSREAGVATVVVRKDKLIIVTVEWMDP